MQRGGVHRGPHRPPDEDTWNEELHLPYVEAKVRSERRAREVADELGVALVTVLPTGVLGPRGSGRTFLSAAGDLDPGATLPPQLDHPDPVAATDLPPPAAFAPERLGAARPARGRDRRAPRRRPAPPRQQAQQRARRGRPGRGGGPRPRREPGPVARRARRHDRRLGAVHGARAVDRRRPRARERRVRVRRRHARGSTPRSAIRAGAARWPAPPAPRSTSPPASPTGRSPPPTGPSPLGREEEFANLLDLLEVQRLRVRGLGPDDPAVAALCARVTAAGLQEPLRTLDTWGPIRVVKSRA